MGCSQGVAAARPAKAQEHAQHKAPPALLVSRTQSSCSVGQYVVKVRKEEAMRRATAVFSKARGHTAGHENSYADARKLAAALEEEPGLAAALEGVCLNSAFHGLLTFKHDGRITWEEFKTFLQQDMPSDERGTGSESGSINKAACINRLFNALGKNGQQQIDAAEFLEFLRTSLGETSETHLKAAMYLAARERGDVGHVAKHELALLCEGVDAATLMSWCANLEICEAVADKSEQEAAAIMRVYVKKSLSKIPAGGLQES